MANPYDNNANYSAVPSNDGVKATDLAADVAADAKGRAADVAADAKGQAADVATHAQDKAAGVASHAGQEAAAVRDTAVEKGAEVVDTAKAEVGAVVDEAKMHGQRLFREGMSELRTQAQQGQGMLAEVLRSVTNELNEMVGGTQQNGPATQVASTLAEFGDRTASWLENKGPQDVMYDVRRYAARNPMAFLAAAAGIGVLGSRIARGLRDDNHQQHELQQRQAFRQEPTYYSAQTQSRPYDERLQGDARLGEDRFGDDRFGTHAGYGARSVSEDTYVAADPDDYRLDTDPYRGGDAR